MGEKREKNRERKKNKEKSLFKMRCVTPSKNDREESEIFFLELQR